MPNLNELLVKLAEKNGSDLHIAPGRPPLARVDGDIEPLTQEVLTAADIEAMVGRLLAPRHRDELEKKRETDFAFSIAEGERFRANIFRDMKGMNGAFRLIPSRIMTIDELGLPSSIKTLCELPKGLILVTGATGMGKSTTLAAFIDHINRHRSEHVITIEDPIEFIHIEDKCLIHQREVYTHTHSFSSALRSALREDPDVIMAGELRDLESMEFAIEAAETGHLVFGTLHTNTAPSTVDRVIDAFPPNRQNQIRAMLANSLRAVISQTLCKCRGGGRTAAWEILIVTRSVSSMIREAKIHQIPSSMQVGGASGMILLNQSLADLVRRGIITPEEAYLNAVDTEDILATYRRANIPWIPHEPIPDM